jgi:hypothetical protein
MTKLKALSVLDARNYVLEKYGIEGQKKVAELLNEADRAIVFSDDLLPVSWVEVDLVVRHVFAFESAFGHGGGKTAREMLKEIANKQFNGIYGNIYKGVSPAQLLNKSPQLWKRFYDTGNATIEPIRDNYLIGKILDCKDLPLSHEILIIPYWEEVLSLVGAKDVKIRHKQCVAKGAEYCITEYEWK